MKCSNRVSVNKAFQTGTVPTKKRKLLHIMLDKKHCNWNGCCIRVLPHVTQRERLYPVLIIKNIVKSSLVLHVTSIDIMVSIYYWFSATDIFLCVWRPGNRAIFMQWMDHCQIHIGLVLDNRAKRRQIPSVHTYT